MYGLKFSMSRVANCDKLRRCCMAIWCQQQQQQQHQKRFVSQQVEPSNIDTLSDDSLNWPRRIFSGIQPTGSLHLGNYLGAVRKWAKLQEARDDVTYCIVDMHSITLPQDSAVLRENIFQMAATMLACGIDPNQSTLFVQSAVKEHSELCWLLGTLSTMARLGHLPQYKEKTRQIKEIPLGLFIYPVLQAADIMLYKTTHVPVGEDQVQHIQLTQHLAKVFNTRFGRTFPICHAMIESKDVSRIRSLRDPTKKMSKSDPDSKATIYVTDEPEIILEKVKKAVTDFHSDVTYDQQIRPGVSNLIAIHSHMSGVTIEKIIDEARTLDTGKYKLRVAEAIIEHLKPIREKIEQHLEDRGELVTMLDNGAEKARNIACDTIEEVKQKMGLGAPYLPMFLDVTRTAVCDDMSEMSRTGMGKTGNASLGSGGGRLAIKQGATPILEAKLATLEASRKLSAIPKPMVPKQQMRIEKKPMRSVNNSHSRSDTNIVDNVTRGLLSKAVLRRRPIPAASQSNTKESITEDINERKVRRMPGCVKIETNGIPSIAAQQTIITASQTKNESTNIIDCPCENSHVTNSKITTTPTTTTPPVITTTIAATSKAVATNAAAAITTTTSTPTPTTLPATATGTSTSTGTATATSTQTTAARLVMTSATTMETAKTTSGGEDSLSVSSSHTSIPKTGMTVTTPIDKKVSRNFATTSPALPCPSKDTDSPPKYEAHKKFKKLFLFGIFAFGAGLSGIYYFCRSILQAFFDIKKNGGD